MQRKDIKDFSGCGMKNHQKIMRTFSVNTAKQMYLAPVKCAGIQGIVPSLQKKERPTAQERRAATIESFFDGETGFYDDDCERRYFEECWEEYRKDLEYMMIQEMYETVV